MKNSINWFAIPATNFQRALKFYEAILDVEMQALEMNGTPMAFFPYDQEGVGGHLFSSPEFAPSADGTTVYLNGGADLRIALDRVISQGGTVLVDKTKISDEHGYFASFMDTEGNKVGLHSPQ